ncbi:transcription initiation factor TFIID subunit 2-like [Linepithema humile]|uniref:transcription initiation factor TFIID subunit 2-like n=1 Tax=Linepithema humile TaxID=83485 RepID=UPI00351F072B
MPLPVESPMATPVPPAANEQTPAVPKGTLDLLVGHQNQPETDALMQQHREHHHHHQHHSHHNNHKKKRSSQGSHSEEA